MGCMPFLCYTTGTLRWCPHTLQCAATTAAGTVVGSHLCLPWWQYFAVYPPVHIFLVLWPTENQVCLPVFHSTPCLPNPCIQTTLTVSENRPKLGGKTQRWYPNCSFTLISPGCLLVFTFKLQKCCKCYTGSSGQLPKHPGEQQEQNVL